MKMAKMHFQARERVKNCHNVLICARSAKMSRKNPIHENILNFINLQSIDLIYISKRLPKQVQIELFKHPFLHVFLWKGFFGVVRPYLGIIKLSRDNKIISRSYLGIIKLSRDNKIISRSYLGIILLSRDNKIISRSYLEIIKLSRDNKIISRSYLGIILLSRDN